MVAQAEHVGEYAPYPMYVRLQGARVVCVGAGEVAARKVEALLGHGAEVVVVAPEACESICSLAADGRISWERRSYEAGDIDGARLAVVATSNRAINEVVAAEADAKNVLANVVDAPELCTFLVPSVVRRGKLQIAVSTDGAAPSVAREIRRDLEKRFPHWWESYVDLLADLRTLVKRRVLGDSSKRARIFEMLGSNGIRERIACGDALSAEQAYAEYVTPLVEEDEAL